MFEGIINVLKETWDVFGEMAPFLLFGFLAAGVLYVLIRPETVERHLGGGDFASVLKAALFGVPLPICSCGVVPVTASLRYHGASRGAAASFLISTPQTGVDSILVTYSLLGPVFAVFRPVAALVSGVLGGTLVNVLSPDTAESRQETAFEIPPRNSTGFAGKVKEALRYGFYSLPRSLGKPLLIGLFAAGLITAVVPDDFFISLLGTGFGAMLAMLVLGIPIYVCATASVPIAAALMMKGISPGAALVFLMTGPATNAASLAVIWKVIGKRSAVIYLAATALTALASGLLLDYIFTQMIPSDIQMTMEAHMMMSTTFKTLSAIALLAVLSVALLCSCEGKASKETDDPTAAAPTGEATESITLKIEGMTCQNCVATIERVLYDCDGVDFAEVILDAKEALVEGNNLNGEALKQAIEEAGGGHYKVTLPER